MKVQTNIKSIESSGVSHVFLSKNQCAKFYGISSGSVHWVCVGLRPSTKTRYGIVSFIPTDEDPDVKYTDFRTLVKERTKKRTAEERKQIQKICHKRWQDIQTEIKQLMRITYI